VRRRATNDPHGGGETGEINIHGLAKAGGGAYFRAAESASSALVSARPEEASGTNFSGQPPALCAHKLREVFADAKILRPVGVRNATHTIVDLN
jgi:hypothetical protein